MHASHDGVRTTELSKSNCAAPEVRKRKLLAERDFSLLCSSPLFYNGKKRSRLFDAHCDPLMISSVGTTWERRSDNPGLVHEI